MAYHDNVVIHVRITEWFRLAMHGTYCAMSLGLSVACSVSQCILCMYMGKVRQCSSSD